MAVERARAAPTQSTSEPGAPHFTLNNQALGFYLQTNSVYFSYVGSRVSIVQYTGLTYGTAGTAGSIGWHYEQMLLTNDDPAWHLA